MATETREIKRNDLQAYYYAKIRDSTKTPIDLTGATIRFTMREILNDGTLSPTKKVDRATTGVVIRDQTTNTGEVYYVWQAGETDTVGVYAVEFEVTPSAGGKFTFPSKIVDRAIVQINVDLDET